MRANSLYFSGTSRLAVVALALLLASCIKSTPTYKIGVTVSGLTGAGLVLQDNGGDDLAISANGYFTFSKQLKKNASYNVTVFAQPAGQTCTVTNGTGTATSNVTDVAVACVANAPTTFTVGGMVSGLAPGTGLVLQNNGGNNLSISAVGAFAFTTALANAATYSVTVLTQPSGQGCQVANGSGSIAGANVTNVAVTCFTPPAAPSVNPIGFAVKELQFSWTAVSGATFYRLLENPDGLSGFGLAATNITATNFNYTIPVHRRLNASYKVEACNPGGCTASAALDLGSNLVKAIGFAKASNTGAGDQFGTAVAVSGDGNTLAVGAPMEDSAMAGVTAGSVPAAGNAATDAGAVYVFARVAGVWSQQAYVKAANPSPVAGDHFGISVALSSDGNTLAVGAWGQAANSGAAYVFTRSAGVWSQQAMVKASNAAADDEFGWAVALSGDGNTLAVGAPFESSAAGAVYVYTRSAGAWPQEAYVKASNAASLDLFGNSVALSGDGNTLAVGAPLEDGGHTGVTAGPVTDATAGNAAPDSGAAYVYTRTAGAWSQQAYVKASNTGRGDNFGTSLSLSGDGNTLAVGAPFEDSSLTGVFAGAVDDATSGNAFFDSGAVYVYARAAGAWAQQAYVKASNTGANDQFGTSVALSGDGTSLAVGAPLEDSSTTGIGSTPDDGLASDTGAVYFYALSAGTWSQQAYVKATNTGDLDEFGWSVALSGDGNTLAVGAPFEDGSGTGIGAAQDDNGAGDAGAAYLY